MADPILTLSGVSKKYHGKYVVDNVALQVKKGDFLTLLGPSGAGKTTVLKLIAGFENISDGCIYLNNENIDDIPANKRNFGMMFQNYALFPHMTVEENIAYPLKLRRYSKADIKSNVRRMLAMVKMSEYGDRYPRQLSGGQQQRVALARAIVFNPPVLLLDEPMAALDKQLRKLMQIEIKRIHDELGLTTISVTHDQEEALTMATRVCVMHNGKVKQIDTPSGIYDRPADTFIANFIGESTVLQAKVEQKRPDHKLEATLVCDGTRIELQDMNFSVNPGDIVTVIIRPEKVKMVENDYDGLKFSGTLKHLIYMGDAFKLIVMTDSGLEFKVKTFSRGQKNLQVGDEILIGLRDSDLVAVKDQVIAAGYGVLR